MAERELTSLWSDFVSGEDAAYGQIFRRCYASLFHYGLRICSQDSLVKDAIQDTFLYIYKHRNQLPLELSNVQAYLLTSFRRNLIHNLQRSQRRQLQNSKASSSELPFTLSVEDIILERDAVKEKKQRLSQLFNKLPNRQREIIYLKYYQGQSISEIADTLKITYQTVANHLHRALVFLRENSSFLGGLKTVLWLLYGDAG